MAFLFAFFFVLVQQEHCRRFWPSQIFVHFDLYFWTRAREPAGRLQSSFICFICIYITCDGMSAEIIHNSNPLPENSSKSTLDGNFVMSFQSCTLTAHVFVFRYVEKLFVWHLFSKKSFKILKNRQTRHIIKKFFRHTIQCLWTHWRQTNFFRTRKPSYSDIKQNSFAIQLIEETKTMTPIGLHSPSNKKSAVSLLSAILLVVIFEVEKVGAFLFRSYQLTPSTLTVTTISNADRISPLMATKGGNIVPVTDSNYRELFGGEKPLLLDAYALW